MGVVKNGSFELGVSGAAGEFGHTIIDYNGPECYCGNRGCIESYCSTIALCSEYKRERINNKLNAAHEYTIAEVAEAVKRGESSAVSVAKRIGMLLGIGIANAINLYNPEAVILGGELCGVPLCIEAAFEEAQRHIFRNASRDVVFLVSSQDTPMLIMGTIAYAMENYFNEYCKC
jgi:predicted NBD/HSP70 family sugar kinase